MIAERRVRVRVRVLHYSNAFRNLAKQEAFVLAVLKTPLEVNHHTSLFLFFSLLFSLHLSYNQFLVF